MRISAVHTRESYAYSKQTEKTFEVSKMYCFFNILFAHKVNIFGTIFYNKKSFFYQRKKLTRYCDSISHYFFLLFWSYKIYSKAKFYDWRIEMTSLSLFYSTTVYNLRNDPSVYELFSTHFRSTMKMLYAALHHFYPKLALLFLHRGFSVCNVCG